MSEPTIPGMGLAKKLASIVADTTWIEKSGRNETQRYNYVEAPVVFQTVRGELATRGIAIFPQAVGIERGRIETKSGGSMEVCVVQMRYTLVDGDSGDTMVCDWRGEGMDSGDKALNKAYTAALKYFLIDLLLLPTGDDPEADESVDSDPPKPAPKAQPKQVRPVSGDRKQLENDFFDAWNATRTAEQKKDPEDWKNRSKSVKEICKSARFLKLSDMTDAQLQACINEWTGGGLPPADPDAPLDPDGDIPF